MLRKKLSKLDYLNFGIVLFLEEVLNLGVQGPSGQSINTDQFKVVTFTTSLNECISKSYYFFLYLKIKVKEKYCTLCYNKYDFI